MRFACCGRRDFPDAAAGARVRADRSSPSSPSSFVLPPPPHPPAAATRSPAPSYITGRSRTSRGSRPSWSAPPPSARAFNISVARVQSQGRRIRNCAASHLTVRDEMSTLGAQASAVPNHVPMTSRRARTERSRRGAHQLGQTLPAFKTQVATFEAALVSPRGIVADQQWRRIRDPGVRQQPARPPQRSLAAPPKK